MSRSRLKSSTLRALGPVVIPLMTRVAIPIAIESLRRRKFAGEDFLDEQKEKLRKNLSKTRSDLEEVKDEAIERGTRLYEEARKEGAELLDVLARKGLEIANEWAQGLVVPKRRRFRFVHALGLAAVVGVGVFLVGRR
jgi:hypothetical protein